MDDYSMSDARALAKDRARRFLGTERKRPSFLVEVLCGYVVVCAAFFGLGIVHGLMAGYFAA